MQYHCSSLKQEAVRWYCYCSDDCFYWDIVLLWFCNLFCTNILKLFYGIVTSTSAVVLPVVRERWVIVSCVSLLCWLRTMILQYCLRTTCMILLSAVCVSSRSWETVDGVSQDVDWRCGHHCLFVTGHTAWWRQKYETKSYDFWHLQLSEHFSLLFNFRLFNKWHTVQYKCTSHLLINSNIIHIGLCAFEDWTKHFKPPLNSFSFRKTTRYCANSPIVLTVNLRLYFQNLLSR